MTSLTRVLGLAAFAVTVAIAAPSGGAQAASLIGPAVATAVQEAPSAKMTSEVRWRRGWHRHHGWRHRGWHHRHHRHWRRW